MCVTFCICVVTRLTETMVSTKAASCEAAGGGFTVSVAAKGEYALHPASLHALTLTAYTTESSRGKSDSKTCLSDTATC